MSDAELRVVALKMAMEYKGDAAWKMDSVMKWTEYFYTYLKTGEWKETAASTTRS